MRDQFYQYEFTCNNFIVRHKDEHTSKNEERERYGKDEGILCSEVTAEGTGDIVLQIS